MKYTVSLVLFVATCVNIHVNAMQNQTAQLHKPQHPYAITPLKKLILDGLAQQLLVPHPFNHIQAIKDVLYSITDQHEQFVVTQEDMRYVTTTYARQLAKASEPLPLYVHTGIDQVIGNAESANIAIPALAATLDLKTQTLTQLCNIKKSKYTKLCFSPKGTYIIYDKKPVLQVFDTQTNQLLHAVIPNKSPYYISPDEHYLIIWCKATQKNTVYALATGNKIGTLPDNIGLHTCTFCSCSSLVAFAECSKDERDNTIAVCSLPSGICLAHLEGSLRAFSPDDQYIVTGHSFLHNGKIQGNIKIYDAHTFDCVENIALELPTYLVEIKYNPESHTVIMYFQGDRSPWVWDRKQQTVYSLTTSHYAFDKYIQTNIACGKLPESITQHEQFHKLSESDNMYISPADNFIIAYDEFKNSDSYHVYTTDDLTPVHTLSASGYYNLSAHDTYGIIDKKYYHFYPKDFTATMHTSMIYLLNQFKHIPLRFEQLLALLIHNYCYKHNQAPDLRTEQVLSGSCPSFVKLITAMRKVKAFLTSYPEYALAYYNPQKRFIVVSRIDTSEKKLYYILDTQQETRNPHLLRLIIGQQFDSHAVLLLEGKLTNTQQECSICFETGVNQPTLCGHIFHDSCLKHWLETHTTCPECRIHLITD